jgi:hypothetical protein
MIHGQQNIKFTPLFYVLASTCFGSSLPSLGSLLDRLELLEVQILWVVYHITCGYVASVPDCRGSVCLPQHRTTTVWHIGRITTRYTCTIHGDSLARSPKLLWGCGTQTNASHWMSPVHQGFISIT